MSRELAQRPATRIEDAHDAVLAADRDLAAVGTKSRDEDFPLPHVERLRVRGVGDRGEKRTAARRLRACDHGRAVGRDRDPAQRRRRGDRGELRAGEREHADHAITAAGGEPRSGRIECGAGEPAHRGR